MSALNILMWSIILYCVGGVVSLLLKHYEGLSIKIAGITGIVGGLLGIWSALLVLFSGEIQLYTQAGPFAFASFIIRMDSLAAFMVFVISLLVTLCSLYSCAYVEEYRGKGAGSMGFFCNIFVASMVGLMVVDNAFYFIILFEMMSLTSWFLVINDQNEESIHAGLLYFFIAHAGSVLIMAAFFLMAMKSGSLDFASFRDLQLSPVMASVVFILGFLGFGAKAGMLPLHSWLPKAHPAAPSHASALMSGVMVKVGVFGIIKVGIDLLGATQMWWGILVIIFGAVSSVLGVLYALSEHDIKRLLAWHTVENIGIILMGVGAAMVGIATDRPILAVLGMVGALYHLLNHAMFKGLLFLGAGSLIYRTHTRDMEKMGGLARLMPVTALSFLIGCMAISALPPLNGFVSEWLTYQSLFNMGLAGSSIAMRLAGPIAMIMLAITGALAALCFVKVYGIAFCGNPRSNAVEHAKEVPATMQVSMLLAALLCILLGLGAAYVVPMLASIAADLAKIAQVSVTDGAILVAGTSHQAMLSPWWMAVMLVLFLLVPIGMYTLFKGSSSLKYRNQGKPWSAGYAWEHKMAPNSRSMTQALNIFFSGLYRLRVQLDPSVALKASLGYLVRQMGKIEPFWDDKIVFPLVGKARWIGQKVQILQAGDARVYCLYVVAAFLIVLVVLAV